MKKYKFVVDKRVAEEIEVEANDFDEAVTRAMVHMKVKGVRVFYQATLFDEYGDAIIDWCDTRGWEDACYNGKHADEYNE